MSDKEPKLKDCGCRFWVKSVKLAECCEFHYNLNLELESERAKVKSLEKRAEADRRVVEAAKGWLDSIRKIGPAIDITWAWEIQQKVMWEMTRALSEREKVYQEK